MNILWIMLQAQQQGAGGGMGSMLILVVVMILFLWLMGGGQRKQAKKEQEFRNNMKKGDRVLFSGGIYGKVHEVGATTVEVEVANGTILTVEKNMIQPVPEPKQENTTTKK